MLTEEWYEVIVGDSVSELQEKMCDLMRHNEVCEFLGFGVTETNRIFFYQAIIRQKGFPRK